MKNKKPARQHGKSKATWKKHRNMEKAPQHDKSNATCNKHRNNIQALHKDHQERSTKMGEHKKATGMDA
jgi:hypothetical protein